MTLAAIPAAVFFLPKMTFPTENVAQMFGCVSLIADNFRNENNKFPLDSEIEIANEKSQ